MTNWRDRNLEDLINQVVGADLTWYERSARRREDNESKDGAKEPRALEEDSESEDDAEESSPFELTIRVGTNEEHDDPPHIRVRERIEMVRDGLESAYDLAVTFRMASDFPTNDPEALGEFVDRVGFEYVLGLIRGAFNDGSRMMGVRPPILPAVAHRMPRPQTTKPRPKAAKSARRKSIS